MPLTLVLVTPSATASTFSSDKLAEFGRWSQALESRAAEAVLNEAADY